jgi:uncharacterized protein
MEPRLAVLGLVVGFLIGVSGVGSGSLMAPLLLLLGIPPATVVGSDLGFSVLTKGTGVGLFVRQKLVRWRWVWLLAAGSLPGTIVGSLLLAHVARTAGTVRAWIAAMLVVTSLAALCFDVLRRRGAAWVVRLQQPPAWVVSVFGLAIGTAVGATSVGSGSLIDITLALFTPLTGAEIVGTGIAHGILLTTVASSVHWGLGTIDHALVLNLLAGSIPGVLAGGCLASRAPSRSVRWGIALLVLLSGVATLTGSCSR